MSSDTREEVLHASDPRHADNLSPAVLKTIMAIGRGGRSTGLTADAEKRGMPRYHSGGIVGAAPNRQSAVDAPVQSAGRGGTAGKATVNVNNYGQPAEAEVKTSTDPSGHLTIDVILNAAANDVRKGGKVAAAGQATLGWRHQTPRRGT